ncbi:hypothetical protein SPRG_13718 [Saprolegnia parasitica CBS 223.65]|uniref:Uncharacterized protein n=1 Tax=Saprolegnia parasitica (strain CBS 223.65) TaxID=695850 RepID=A0A067BSK8_SAPPC|nr:hypothetical protein SPRG_13718 [Saprolegnia parasitica CBS 223.65]KDO21218.1 hypothetical protein SPRG_13718 [Saprolegnia parasitica CBS 223.65]|eukprot:XP_012208051.1 hypothetical protein SPRG_13718 [Saprolegnia parasitica CBS 223.65]
MATKLYRVRVVRVHRGKCIVVSCTCLLFRVYNIYYDGGRTVPSDASFFVFLLDDDRFLFRSYANVGPNSVFPSANEPFAIATNGHRLNPAWMKAKAHAFVKRVERTAYSPSTLETNPAFVYSGYQQERQLEQGVYEVEYTDPKWIEHCKVGHVWQTCCFDMLHSMPIVISRIEPTTKLKTSRGIAPSSSKATKKPIKKTKAIKAGAPTKISFVGARQSFR